MRKVIAVILTGLWIAGVAAFVMSSQDRRVVSSQYAQWPTIQGNIISSEITDGTNPNGETYYRLNVKFGYKVEGKLYSSSQSWYTAGPGDERKYPTRASVPVHYNPQEPQTAIIEPRKVLSDWIALLVQAIFYGAIISAIIFFNIWPHGKSHNQTSSQVSQTQQAGDR